MPEKPLIKLENVWKVYQMGGSELNVLQGINLEINPGAFVSILGRSGSGKSTLLHIIGCLDLPTKGKVLLDGKDVSLFSENKLSQIRGEKIGFIFQQFNLLPNLSALENVTLPMVFRGTPAQKRKEKAEELLFYIGLEKRIFHRPSELSGGEQQRIAIARALSNDPEIIVADEPTGNLDSETGKKIMELLSDLHQKQNKTIIVVTHDPYIANYSKEAIHIKDGKIVSNHLKAAAVLWQPNS